MTATSKQGFNTQPPEGGWLRYKFRNIQRILGFNTQPPEGGWKGLCTVLMRLARFNTQPPEGGWSTFGGSRYKSAMFQHTAARRRLDIIPTGAVLIVDVSTHSRPKAAGVIIQFRAGHSFKFQHTAARRRLVLDAVGHGFSCVVSTHSRPKAAGTPYLETAAELTVSTHSRPKAAG